MSNSFLQCMYFYRRDHKIHEKLPNRTCPPPMYIARKADFLLELRLAWQAGLFLSYMYMSNRLLTLLTPLSVHVRATLTEEGMVENIYDPFS